MTLAPFFGSLLRKLERQKKFDTFNNFNECVDKCFNILSSVRKQNACNIISALLSLQT